MPGIEKDAYGTRAIVHALRRRSQLSIPATPSDDLVMRNGLQVFEDLTTPNIAHLEELQDVFESNKTS